MTNDAGSLVRPSRRGLLFGLGVLFAAPAIVRASSLMPIKGTKLVIPKLYTLDDYAEQVLKPMVRKLEIQYGWLHVQPSWVANLPDALVVGETLRIKLPSGEIVREPKA